MSLPKVLSMKSVNGDISVPAVGFGTWASGDKSWCYEATLNALKAGYRHIDCAWNYGVSLPFMTLPFASDSLLGRRSRW